MKNFDFERVDMKKSGVVTLLLVVIMSFSFVLTACDKNSDNNDVVQRTDYIIQYTDDTGTYTINVKSGEPYSMSAIPSREGYDFIGLYDAESGGTQYVNSQGASLAPFTDNKNLVLFPQFKAKEYKVILNYGDAPVTSVREISVEYDSELPELPVNLTAENKDFKGWYTEPNCGGTQIADTFGVLPDRRLITEQNFDLTNANGYIYLYAGFRGTMRTVTFYGESGSAPIEMQIEHGTSIGNIVPDYRTEEGFAVLEWTQDPNPTESSPVYKGEITGDMTLYAKTYAPVIEFDANGGEKIVPLVQTAGKKITLPTPVRTNYKFLYWADANGEKINYAVMPSASVKATAVWQAMIIFDENGGTDVKDISQETGTVLSLPEPEKEGFIFAGWYTSDGEKYESASMPSVSKTLKAGWYKTKTETVVICGRDKSKTYTNTSPSMDNSWVVGLSELLESNVKKINLTLNYSMYVSGNMAGSRPKNGCIDIYGQPSVSSQYLLLSIWKSPLKASQWETYSVSETLQISSEKLYLCPYMSSSGLYYKVVFSDVYVNIEYPDTTKLY